MENTIQSYFSACLGDNSCASLYSSSLGNFSEQLSGRIVAFGMKYGKANGDLLLGLMQNQTNQDSQRVTLLLLETCEYGHRLNLKSMRCETIEGILFEDMWGVSPYYYTPIIICIIVTIIIFAITFATCWTYNVLLNKKKRM